MQNDKQFSKDCRIYSIRNPYVHMDEEYKNIEEFCIALDSAQWT